MSEHTDGQQEPMDEQYPPQETQDASLETDGNVPSSGEDTDLDSSGAEFDYTEQDDTYDVDVNVDQKPVKFREELAVSRKPNQGESLDNPVAIIRESYANMAKVLDQHTNLLDEIQRRESALVKALNKRGRGLQDTDGNRWYRNLMEGLSHSQINGMGLASSSREGSEWLQVLDHEGTKLRPGQPKQRIGGGGHSKEETLAYLTRRAGTGTVFDVPLYRSGVWLRFKSPSLAELTGLQYQLTQLRVELGTQTKGLAFSNITQTMKSTALDFCMQFVIDANVHYQSPSDLKQYISLTDADVLLWGMGVTLYPKGFPYSHSCIADVTKCQHITQEILNLNRLLWTDTQALTAKQRKHMAQRFTKISDDDYQAYQREHLQGSERIVWFSNELGLRLKVPNLQEYEDAGREWIDGIIAMTQGAFNEPPHGSNRNQYINSLGIATTARQYSHWVSGIYELDEDEQQQLVTEQGDVINETLNHIFSAEDQVEDFFDKVTEYIDDCLISMVAIPSFNCPRCNSPVAEKFHERFPHLVPLDVLTTFFTLVDRKLS